MQMRNSVLPTIATLVLWLLLGVQCCGCFSLQNSASPIFRTTFRTPQSRVALSVVGTVNIDNEQLSNSVGKKSSFHWNEQWYPAFPLEYLNDAEDQRKPISVVVLGRKLVIWKSNSVESGWSIFDDSCPHRRSPLSTGQVVDDGTTCSLRCRHHGWEFDSVGSCTKIPMQTAISTSLQTNRAFSTNSYPTKAAGGLLWVYLGKKVDKDLLPEIPAGSLLSDEESELTSWEFFVNPMSFLTMIENSLDPAHAPYTHQGISGLGGGDFSPDDALPMARYDVVESKGEHGGFTLEHTPYQRSAAKIVGENCTNTRSFIPPCTIVAAVIPFFKVNLWFVPATPTSTTVIGRRGGKETKMMKLTRNFPKLRGIFRDWSHSSEYWSDNGYRFFSQDRLTMQGQEQNKLEDKRWWDLTPSKSDNGVQTMQKWMRDFGGLGPFPWMNGVSPDSIPRQLSLWEAHGKYCPKCQRTMKRVMAVEAFMERWFAGTLVASAISASFAACAQAIWKGSKLSFLTPLSMMFVVACLGCRWTSEWSKTIQQRMHGKGDELWQRRLEIFSYDSPSTNLVPGKK